MKRKRLNKLRNFYIEINGRRKYFETLKSAQAVCSLVHKSTGVILGIVPTEKQARKQSEQLVTRSLYRFNGGI